MDEPERKSSLDRSSMDEGSIEYRVEMLEHLNSFIPLLLRGVPSPLKEWDLACFRGKLTFQQEMDSRKTIYAYLDEDRGSLDDLLDEIEEIVGNRATAIEVVKAVKRRGTQRERWREFDVDNVLGDISDRSFLTPPEG